jgi:hypothetical protein
MANAAVAMQPLRPSLRVVRRANQERRRETIADAEQLYCCIPLPPLATTF